MLTRKCQFCELEAVYDAPTRLRGWAYMCELHYEGHANKAFPPIVLSKIGGA